MRWTRAFTLILTLGTIPFAAVSQDTPSAAELYEQGMAEYNQVNYGGALSKFRESAELGHAPAQTRLAELLDASEFNEEARAWFEKAVVQRDISAQKGLARMLALGDGGEQDLERARSLYQAAADQGDHEAMRILFTAWRDGGLGLEPNAEEAERWLRRAAEAGDAWSQEYLAEREGG